MRGFLKVFLVPVVFTLLTSTVFVPSTLAYTADQNVRADAMSCEDLQSLLQQERSLNILSGRFNWGVVHKYYADDCGLKYASPSRVRTLDRRSCYAGYVCLRY